ncbi:methyltransferase domain-containing protein [Conexibacter arvalis]|uniref:tRNA (Cmo5U34)-methyltransferase n=1 Tax=Conexibacter arvalis TaxID=912552 RepID=A0A840IEW0_9ACTN|nr:tRNA (cmo5U34)-methyltransferase [Conexibacter arvalis]
MGEHTWDPEGYDELMRAEIPDYPLLQAELVAATEGIEVASVLELGTGTGQTARRLLDAHPEAHLVGIDASEAMLMAARSALLGRPASLLPGRLEEPLPAGRFDLVVSALAVHHLDGPGKAGLFARVACALRPGGRFALADVVVPDDPADARIPLEPGYDLPSTVAEQLGWLRAAGLADARVTWRRGDLAVLAADRPPEG